MKTTGDESASLIVILSMREVEVAFQMMKTAASMLQDSWKSSGSRKLARASSPFRVPLFSAVLTI